MDSGSIELATSGKNSCRNSRKKVVSSSLNKRSRSVFAEHLVVSHFSTLSFSGLKEFPDSL